MPSLVANIGKGIDAVTSSQIPKEWDADWFSRFIQVWLSNGDARNALGAGGIAVTGSPTQEATVSGSNFGSYYGGAPTATVGITPVVGTAQRFIRSDSAPAIDQTMSPVWTGTHTFQSADGTTVTVNFTQGVTATWNLNNPGATTDFRFTCVNGDAFIVNYTGGITIPAPTSGRCITINDSTMMRTNVAFGNGASHFVGALTNAPSAGNPTKWIPIDDNGNILYIPAW